MSLRKRLDGVEYWMPGSYRNGPNTRALQSFNLLILIILWLAPSGGGHEWGNLGWCRCLLLGVLSVRSTWCLRLEKVRLTSEGNASDEWRCLGWERVSLTGTARALKGSAHIPGCGAGDWKIAR